MAIQIDTLIKGGTKPFPNFTPMTDIAANYEVDPLTDYGLNIDATANDVTVTLPLLSSLGATHQVLDFIPNVANGFKIRVLCQGADTFASGNTWFDIPTSQQHFSICMHSGGFILRRNIGVSAAYLLSTTPWGSANFATPTAIPWEEETSNTQSEILNWAGGVGTGAVTVLSSGTYLIAGGANYSPLAVQKWQVDGLIYVDGIAVPFLKMQTGGDGNNKESFYASTLIDLTAGQVIEMRLEHVVTSAAVNVTSAYFSIGIRL